MFLVLYKTFTPDGKVPLHSVRRRMCDNRGRSKKLAQFPNLRDPIIVNLDQVKRPRAKLKLD
jgi:hypothetical protein